MASRRPIAARANGAIDRVLREYCLIRIILASVTRMMSGARMPRYAPTSCFASIFRFHRLTNNAIVRALSVFSRRRLIFVENWSSVELAHSHERSLLTSAYSGRLARLRELSNDGNQDGEALLKRVLIERRVTWK